MPTKTTPGKCFNEKKTKNKERKNNLQPKPGRKKASSEKKANSQQPGKENKEKNKTHADLEQQRKPTNHGKY